MSKNDFKVATTRDWSVQIDEPEAALLYISYTCPHCTAYKKDAFAVVYAEQHNGLIHGVETVLICSVCSMPARVRCQWQPTLLKGGRNIRYIAQMTDAATGEVIETENEEFTSLKEARQYAKSCAASFAEAADMLKLNGKSYTPKDAVKFIVVSKQ